MATASLSTSMVRQWAHCACCSPLDFDPVPLNDVEAPPRPLLRRRPLRPGLASRRGLGGLLRAQPCSAGASEAPAEERSRSVLETSPSQEGEAEEQQRRNVVARSQSRFESGLSFPEQPDWEQFSDCVISILGKNPSPFTLNGTNCYLVGTGSNRLLIDAGEEHYGSEEFMANLERCMHEHSVEGLSGVLVTHMHHDHYGNIGALQAKYGPMPVYSYELDEEDRFKLLRGLRERDLERFLVNGEGHPAYKPRLGGSPADQGAPELPEGTDLTWAEPFVKQFPGSDTSMKVRFLFYYQWHSSWLLDRLRTGVFEWRRLREGDSISVEGATLTPLHTPGHAPDHVSFLLEEEHSLFSGDHVLGWGTTLVFDMKDYMATLRRMLELKPARLYPGHGPIIEDGVDLLSRYIDHRERREAQAWEALQRRTGPASVFEVAMELYPDTSRDRLWMAADNLEKLFRKFAGDGSVGAWRVVSASDAAERLVPFEVPRNSYSEWRLPEGLRWAARRSMVRHRRDLLERRPAAKL